MKAGEVLERVLEGLLPEDLRSIAIALEPDAVG